jgi:hypothetical protein
MKLSPNNIFTQIFTPDPYNGIVSFGYEIDEGPLPISNHIIISNIPEIRIKKHITGSSEYIVPFAWDTEQQFNDLTWDALIQSCKISNNTINSFYNINTHFQARGLDCAKCFIPELNEKDTSDLSIKLYEQSGLDWLYYTRRSGYMPYKPIPIPYLKPNEVLFTTEPEYLGVISSIPISDTEELYGVGILNPNGAILVRL